MARILRRVFWTAVSRGRRDDECNRLRRVLSHCESTSATHALRGARRHSLPRQRCRERMSLDETFSENAPTVGPQIRTLRLVEHVRPSRSKAYLEWSREFSDAHANFIAAQTRAGRVVMIRRPRVWKSRIVPT